LRQGGADDGRDIEATFTVNNSLIGGFDEKFFFECKRHKKGVPPEKLNSKIAWADAESPQHFVLILSSYISNNGQTWLDKIRKTKHYKIHVIDGKILSKLLSQHEDIVTKYFIKDKHYNVLLNTIEKWLLSFISPNFETLCYLWENLDFKILTTNQKVFLYVMYYCDLSEKEFENEHNGEVEVSDILRELSNNLKTNPNCGSLVLKNEKIFSRTIQEGYFYSTNKDCDFIATQAGIRGGGYVYYLFRRLSKNEAIEVCLYSNSTLDYKIRYIRDYNIAYYIEAVKHLLEDIVADYSYQRNCLDRLEKIIERSVNMK